MATPTSDKVEEEEDFKCQAPNEPTATINIHRQSLHDAMYIKTLLQNIYDDITNKASDENRKFINEMLQDTDSKLTNEDAEDSMQFKNGGEFIVFMPATTPTTSYKYSSYIMIEMVSYMLLLQIMGPSNGKIHQNQMIFVYIHHR